LKNKLIGIFLLLAISRLSSKKLPAPYDTLKELKPFLNHGWHQDVPQPYQLIDQYQIKIIVEIGAWLGLSTMDLAQYLPEDGVIYIIDHWLGSSEHQPNQNAQYPCLPYRYE